MEALNKYVNDLVSCGFQNQFIQCLAIRTLKYEREVGSIIAINLTTSACACHKLDIIGVK